MTSPPSLIQLAERVEAATGPDETLDVEIWDVCAATAKERELVRIGGELFGEDEAEFRRARLMDGARYTASLDAAMSLVPEGCFPIIDADPRHIEVEIQYLTDETDNGLGALVATGGKTPALALTAAALRAIASQEQGE